MHYKSINILTLFNVFISHTQPWSDYPECLTSVIHLVPPLTNDFFIGKDIKWLKLAPSGNTLAWFSKNQLCLPRQSMRTSSMAKRTTQNRRSLRRPSLQMHSPLSVPSQRATRRKFGSVVSSSQEGRSSGLPLLVPSSRALQYCFLMRPPVHLMLSPNVGFKMHLIEL